ncbi:lipocalin family protein [Acinetobacter baumannii]
MSTSKSTGVSYWEGATTVKGQMNGKPVTGQAYVEMTGYAEKFHKKI